MAAAAELTGESAAPAQSLLMGRDLMGFLGRVLKWSVSGWVEAGLTKLRVGTGWAYKEDGLGRVGTGHAERCLPLRIPGAREASRVISAADVESVIFLRRREAASQLRWTRSPHYWASCARDLSKKRVRAAVKLPKFKVSYESTTAGSIRFSRRWAASRCSASAALPPTADESARSSPLAAAAAWWPWWKGAKEELPPLPDDNGAGRSRNTSAAFLMCDSSAPSAAF